MPEEKKPYKQYVKEEAMVGTAYGFYLVEKWKDKLKIKWVIRTLIIGLILFFYYKVTNGFMKIGLLVLAILILGYWMQSGKKSKPS